MNTEVFHLVRSAVLAAWLACALGASAQDGSLTREFPKMSAKERSRIAAKEAAEAAQDQAYQTRMEEAERAFQAGRYEEALAAYEKARELRPYNVYPKVKIEDLKALLKRQAEAAPDTAHKPVPPSPAVATNTPPTASSSSPAPLPPSSPPASPAKPTVPAQRTPPPAPPVTLQPASRPDPVQPKVAPPLRTEERRYKQGNATIVERTVDDEGQRVVYKRVAHPWGQVFYFKDGLSVDERVWKDRFNEP